MMHNSGRSATKVLIVNDHPVVLSGWRSLFASDNNTVKIEEATHAKSGHRAYLARKPDVTVIDIKLPYVSGFELMRRMRKDDPEARFIMFSMNDDPALVVRAIEMGAQGYVSKGDDPSGSGDLFRRVDQGQSGVANDGAPARNSSAAGPRRQDRRSRQCAGDFLQDGGQHHLIAQAEAWRQEPFGPDPDRGGDGAGLTPA